MTHEQVDDLPLLLAHFRRMDLPALLDAHFTPHGNWQGLSLGWVITVWLTHVLSQGDHCLSHVRPWVAQRLQTLGQVTDQPLTELDFTDDRLASVLDYLSREPAWQALEGTLSQRLLRVYALTPAQVRLDATHAPSFRDENPEGLFRVGHSGGLPTRGPLPQLKLFLASLDPLSLPIAALLISGNEVDDPWYLPAVTRVRACLGQRGLLYVGDCKMGVLATRAALAAGGDLYLCPLGSPQLSAGELAAWVAEVWETGLSLETVYHDPAPCGHPTAKRDGGTPAAPRPATVDAAWLRAQILAPEEPGPEDPVAVGYVRTRTRSAQVDGQAHTWTERCIVGCSLRQARADGRKLQRQWAAAEAALERLNPEGRYRRRYRSQAALQEAVQKIVQRHQVADLVEVEYETTTVRHGAHCPETVYRIRWRRVEAAWEARLRLLGWRAYATNAPASRLPLAQVILTYRQQYLIERDFSRLKSRPLSLTPIYLQAEHRIRGLVRLLTLALRALCLLEYGVRQELAARREWLTDLYPGQPGRRTARPSSELLLSRFRGIALLRDETPPGRRVLSRFTGVHERILHLLGFSPALYHDLEREPGNHRALPRAPPKNERTARTLPTPGSRIDASPY